MSLNEARPRALLVYPRVPETYWSYSNALPFVGKRATMPPLGLLTVAAIAGDAFSYRLLDLNVRRLTDEDLAWADLVMVSAMIVQAQSMRSVVARCNKAGVPVVAGGPYPTACHEEIRGVDYFVLGEAELVLPRFVEDYLVGRAERIYTCEGRADIADSPIPRFDLCELAAYNTIPVQFSRGCPFDCEFCDIVSLFGHKPRAKGSAQFISEIEALYALGFRGELFIVDDNFIANRRAVKDLLRHLGPWQRRHRFPFRLSTEASIDLAQDEELLDLMTMAGFNMVFVGLETPDDATLIETAKFQNARHSMRRAVRTIQRRGIEVTAGFIIGFDTDPPDIFRRQLRFIQQVAVPTAMVGLLTVLPNTRLHQRLSKAGRMLSRTNGNNTHQQQLNYVPRMPADRIIRGYRWLLKRVYAPRRYFQRCFRFVTRLPRRDRERNIYPLHRVRPQELRALVLSLSKQGISRYAFWYVLYLARAVLRRPRQIVRIITMAVQGHHYFTITRTLDQSS